MKLSLSFIEENFSTIEENLKAILPSGSGFDTTPCIYSMKNGNIIVTSSYHCVDEYGYYCGRCGFTVKFVNGENLGDFVLSFNSRTAQQLNKRFMMCDYIETTIYEQLLEFDVHDKKLDALVTLF